MKGLFYVTIMILYVISIPSMILPKHHIVSLELNNSHSQHVKVHSYLIVYSVGL